MPYALGLPLRQNRSTMMQASLRLWAKSDEIRFYDPRRQECFKRREKSLRIEVGDGENIEFFSIEAEFPDIGEVAFSNRDAASGNLVPTLAMATEANGASRDILGEVAGAGWVDLGSKGRFQKRSNAWFARRGQHLVFDLRGAQNGKRRDSKAPAAGKERDGQMKNNPIDIPEEKLEMLTSGITRAGRNGVEQQLNWLVQWNERTRKFTGVEVDGMGLIDAIIHNAEIRHKAKGENFNPDSAEGKTEIFHEIFGNNSGDEQGLLDAWLKSPRKIVRHKAGK